MKYLFFVLLFLVACRKPPVTSSTDVVKFDSVVVRDILRRDTVRIAGDTVKIRELINCDENNKVVPFSIQKKSGRESVKISVDKKGVLQVDGVCDSLNKVVQLMDQEIFHLRRETSKRVEVVTVYKTRTIDLICRWISGIFLLIAGLWTYKTFH